MYSGLICAVVCYIKAINCRNPWKVHILNTSECEQNVRIQRRMPCQFHRHICAIALSRSFASKSGPTSSIVLDAI